MLSLPTLLGAIAGTAVFNGLALLLTKAWPRSVQKILIIGIVMFFILALGDNAIREHEPMQVTFLRVGIAQVLVTFLLLIGELSRKPSAPRDPAR
jgi:hypothetical protein